jgi:hypothetical protein
MLSEFQYLYGCNSTSSPPQLKEHAPKEFNLWKLERRDKSGLRFYVVGVLITRGIDCQATEIRTIKFSVNPLIAHQCPRHVSMTSDLQSHSHLALSLQDSLFPIFNPRKHIHA